MNTTAIQLDITRPSGTHTFNNHVYATTPGSGKYLQINGISLTMLSASPGTCSTFCTVQSGTLNW
jgi:hypothetical protein